MEDEILKVMAAHTPFSLITIIKVYNVVKSYDLTANIFIYASRYNRDPLDLMFNFDNKIKIEDK